MNEKGETGLIAITGGIGSGKSTVGEMLFKRGYTVVDTDQIARELTMPGSPLLDEIVAEFGDDVLDSEKHLDRRKVAGLVFTHREKLKALERIMHPKIVDEYSRRVEESSDRWVFVLIPLLFEAGRENAVDRIWLCYAPADTRLERTVKRDNGSRTDVLDRMSMQIPDEEKISRADVVIDTSGSLRDTERQVDKSVKDLEKSG
jgi:dephospho-CoA kinase